MLKSKYTNTVSIQLEEMVKLSKLQIENSFNIDKLNQMLPKEKAERIKKIIISGCGDSYSAAGAVKDIFKNSSGVETLAICDPMELAKFLSSDQIKGKYSKEEILLISISASGGSARVVEIISKLKELEIPTMLITNNVESVGAKTADFVFYCETPEGLNTPGIRSYFASMVSLVAISAYIGICKDNIEEARFNEIQSLIMNYIAKLMQNYEEIDMQMFCLAKEWQDFDRFEVIGDWDEYFSAQFIEEKIIECAGSHCTHADSEDWCHINFHLRNSDRIGTIFLLNSKANDYDRMLYTIQSAIGCERPILVITDADIKDLSNEIKVCSIPYTEETWLMPFGDFIPGSLLAGYLASVPGRFFFKERYDYINQKWNI